jgi:hypothetical protein
VRASRLAAIGFWLISAGLHPVAAQVIQSPQGSTRGVFGTAGSQATGAPVFAVTFDGDGGYDDNSVDGSDDASSQFFAFQSGLVSTGSASARFQAGTAQRYILGLASSGITAQQVRRGDRFFRQWRSSASLQAVAPLGRRSGFSASAGVSYDPTFVFGAFDSVGRNGVEENPLEPDPALTPDPTLSLTSQRWLTRRIGAGAFRNWTPRQRTNVDYSGLWLRPSEGPGIQNRTHSTVVTHAWSLSATTGLDAVYRLDRWTLTQEGIEASPINAHTVEGRFRHERRLSPNRSAAVVVGGGAVALDDTQRADRDLLDQVSPTVSASIQLNFQPTWSVALGARRDVTVLGALYAEPFEAKSVTLSLETTPTRRFSAGATAAYSDGGASRSSTGGFTQASANARLQYAFGPSFGATVSYAYGHYRFRDVDVALAGAPSQFGRHSVRVGFTYWLPLYGTF